MARDPVCGMNVKEDKTGFRSEYNGQSFYFCSDKCQKEFDKSPASYVRDRGAQPEPKSKDDKKQQNPRPR